MHGMIRIAFDNPRSRRYEAAAGVQWRSRMDHTGV